MDEHLYFWKEARGKAHNLVFQTFENLQEDLKDQRVEWAAYQELYYDRIRNVIELGPMLGYRGTDEMVRDEQYMSMNVVQSCVDSVVARLAMRLPIVDFSGENSTEAEQDRYRGQERFVRAWMKQDDHRFADQMALRNWTTCGTAITKSYPLHGKIQTDAIHPNDFVVDPKAAYNGRAPYGLHLAYYDKETLLADWLPEKKTRAQAAVKEAIEKAAEVSDGATRSMVEVIEAVLRPRGSRAGRRIICTRAGTLLDEEWPYDDLGVAVARWKVDEEGSWYGIGGVKEIAGYQREINLTIEALRQNIEHNSKIHTTRRSLMPGVVAGDEETKGDADLVERRGFQVYEGERLDVTIPQLFSPQQLQWLNLCWDRSFEQFGLSQLTATAQKPPGLRSGVALQTYHDVETIRYSQQENELMALRKQQAWGIVRAAKMMLANKEDPRAKVPGRNSAGRKIFSIVKWGDVDVESDKIVIDAHPISAFSVTPTARRQQVANAMQAGLYSRAEARAHLGEPDVEKADRLANARYEWIERACERILAGEEVKVSKWMDFGLALDLGAAYLQRAEMDGVEQDKLDKLDAWLVEVEQLADEAAKRQAAMQAEANAQPGGANPQAAQQLAEARAAG